MKNNLSIPFTSAGIRQLVKDLSAESAISIPELSKRSGVHFTTLYGILRNSRVVRMSTIRKLAESVGYRVTVRGNHLMLSPGKSAKQTFSGTDHLESFGKEIADLLRRLGYSELSRKDRYRIKEIVKLLLKR